MAKKTSYHDFLRQEMGSMLDGLDLPDLCKQSLKSRWLDQVIWADKKADQCRRWYYRLRLTTIVGGVLLPALVGLNSQFGDKNDTWSKWFPYAPFALSQIIAVSAAAEEFLRFGERWREYRQLAEDLKAEGWEYLQLSGPYQHKDSEDDTVPLRRRKIADFDEEEWQTLKPRRRSKHNATHQDVYTLFAGRIENLLEDNMQSYISALQQKQTKENEQLKQILANAEEVAADKELFARPEPPPQLPPRGYSNAPNNGGGRMLNGGAAPMNALPPGGQLGMGQPNGSGAYPNPPMQQPPMQQPVAQLAAYGNPPMQQAVAQPAAYPNPAMQPPMQQPPMQQAVAQPAAYPNPAMQPPMQQPPMQQAVAQPAAYGHPGIQQPVAQPAAYPNPAMQPPMQQPVAQPPAYGHPAMQPPMQQPMQQPAIANDLNARILASAQQLRDMSSADGPDGGNNACAWMMNKVLQNAGIQPIGDNPNFVPSVLSALQQGRGQQVTKETAKAGDLVIAAGEAHIGVGLTDGCSRVLSNSSGTASFSWESDADYDGYYGGASVIYRLLR